jgi:plasmid replication initiation protein
MKKNKELVVHHNNLTESIYNFNELELNLFVVIICKMRNESENLVKFEANEIKTLINSKNRSYSRFEKVIHGLQDRTIELKTESGYKRVKPFPTLDFDLKNKTVEVEMNSKLIPQFRELKERFTKYLLADFLNLKSKYSKRIFQLLKQYESIGKRDISIEDLKRFLECNTDGYKKLYILETRILKPSLNDINTSTSMNVGYEKIKNGRKVVGFHFFINESSKISISDKLKKENKEISEKINKAKDKAKKNIYVSKKWDSRTDAKVRRLVKEYGEEYTVDILNELYKGCKKEILTTVVQYINGIIKNKPKGIQNVTEEKISKKEVISIIKPVEEIKNETETLSYKVMYEGAISLIEKETKGSQRDVFLRSLKSMKSVEALSSFLNNFKNEFLKGYKM